MSDETKDDKNEDEGIDTAKNEPGCSEESVLSITVTYCNENYSFEIDRNTTISELKTKLEPLTDVPVERQKLIYKRTLSDDMKIGDINITEKKRKIMLMGSKRSDQGSPVKKFSKPESAIPAVDVNVQLEEGETLTGLLDSAGKPLRMRFEQSSRDLFLATRSSTYRIPLSSITEAHIFPIDGDPNYFILKLRAFSGGRLRNMQIHWIPRQYILDIQDKLKSRQR